MKFCIFLIFSLYSISISEEVKFIKQLDAGMPQKIVVYGTSLTAKGPWVSMLNSKLKEKYGDRISLINSGGSGKDSNWGLANLQKKVISNKPNVVFIEFGMNDAVVRFKNSKGKIRSNVSSMISKIKKALPGCEIILMTMNPALGIPEGHRSARTNLDDYYEIYRVLAKKNKLKIIDHFRNWQAFLGKKDMDYKQYIPDGIHPNKSGCEKVIIPEMVQIFNL